MIAPSHNSLCEEAELYYYQFFYNESEESIPEFIVNHINQCQHCQERIDQLKAILSRPIKYSQMRHEQISSAINVMLELHFACIGKRVTCKTVKPFLPSLLEPYLKIEIPTPITAHLDKCQKCSDDLETIRELNLNRKQLHRLSELFAEKPGEDNISCSQAQAAILAVVSLAFHETNKEVLKHLCTCPDCRKLLYERRGTVCEGYLLDKGKTEEFPCESVSMADIFDYAVPYGLDPTKNQYAKFRQSITSHIRSCPTCLTKMQQLHNTVFGIVERTESEVVTIYHIDESAKVKAASESDDLYAGFPIRVEVTGREDKVKTKQPIQTIDFTTALKQKVLTKKLKPLLKTTVAAAAVILIGVILFLNIPTAKAVTVQRIYKAIEKVKNVHILKFVPDKAKPTQELWVSRTLRIYMTKTGEQWILWDLANGLRKSKHHDTNVAEMVPLNEDDIAGIETKINGTLGLIPFNDIRDIPKGAIWSRADEDDLESITQDIEVYDLILTEREYGGPLILKKWRFFVGLETNLPHRVEFYQKLATNNQYSLKSVMNVQYLSNSEMQEIIQDISL